MVSIQQSNFYSTVDYINSLNMTSGYDLYDANLSYSYNYDESNYVTSPFSNFSHQNDR